MNQKGYLAAIVVGLSVSGSAFAQWSTHALSEPKNGVVAVTVAGVAVFAGGIQLWDSVDLYHSSTGLWSNHQLSEARDTRNTAVVGSRALIVGGLNSATQASDKLDIYDAALDSWSVLTLPRPLVGATLGVSGPKLMIVKGGLPVEGTIDILDTSTLLWSTAQLSIPRSGVAAATAGRYTLLAGGHGNAGGSDVYSTVDVYDAVTDSWSVAQLSQPSSGAHAIALGTKIFFAGGVGAFGIPTGVVDIFDATNMSWTTANLATPRTVLKTVRVGQKLMFIGAGVPASQGQPIHIGDVDIYDSLSDSWTFLQLRENPGAACVLGNDKVIIGGQWFQDSIFDFAVPLTRVDIYDASADVWYQTELSTPRFGMGATSVGNKAMFAGGNDVFGTGLLYDVIDIYEELGTEYCPPTPNSTGRGTEMFVVGSASISDDNLGLRAGPIPGTPSLFLYSTKRANLPFGDGSLCLGAPRRYLGGPVLPDNEVAGIRLRTTQLHSVPGRLHFQCLYRDPAAGGSGWNTSMAYVIDFVP